MPRVLESAVNMTITRTTASGTTTTPVKVASGSIEGEIDSWGYRCNISLANPSDIYHLYPDPEFGPPIAEVSGFASGAGYRFLVEDYGHNLAFNKTGVSFTGRTPSALLGPPYCPAINFSNPEAALISEIAENIAGAFLAGVGATWEPAEDWTLQKNLFSYYRKTPIEALVLMAEQLGLVLRSDPFFGNLSLRKRYSLDPWTWDTAPVGNGLGQFRPLSLGERISLQRKQVMTPDYNSVYVCGSNWYGVLAYVHRADPQEPTNPALFIAPLINHADAARLRGATEIAKTRRREELTVVSPLGFSLHGGYSIAYEPGDLIALQDEGYDEDPLPPGSLGEIRGQVAKSAIAFQVQNEVCTVRQTLTIETKPAGYVGGAGIVITAPPYQPAPNPESPYSGGGESPYPPAPEGGYWVWDADSLYSDDEAIATATLSNNARTLQLESAGLVAPGAHNTGAEAKKGVTSGYIVYGELTLMAATIGRDSITVSLTGTPIIASVIYNELTEEFDLSISGGVVPYLEESIPANGLSRRLGFVVDALNDLAYVSLDALYVDFSDGTLDADITTVAGLPLDSVPVNLSVYRTGAPENEGGYLDYLTLVGQRREQRHRPALVAGEAPIAWDDYPQQRPVWRWDPDSALTGTFGNVDVTGVRQQIAQLSSAGVDTPPADQSSEVSATKPINFGAGTYYGEVRVTADLLTKNYLRINLINTTVFIEVAYDTVADDGTFILTITDGTYTYTESGIAAATFDAVFGFGLVAVASAGALTEVRVYISYNGEYLDWPNQVLVATIDEVTAPSVTPPNLIFNALYVGEDDSATGYDATFQLIGTAANFTYAPALIEGIAPEPMDHYQDPNE